MRPRPTISLPALLILISTLTGCTIAPYDQATDTSLMSIQKQVDSRLSALAAGPQVAGTQPTDYSDWENDVHSLIVRTNSRPQADPSIKKEAAAIAELDAFLADLPKLAQTNPPAAAWLTAQQQFDAAIEAILALELQRQK
jgi:hypothetical protein